MVKDRESVVGGFPKNLAENRESLENSRNVSIILDMSRSFSVWSRCLAWITGATVLRRSYVLRMLCLHITYRFLLGKYRSLLGEVNGGQESTCKRNIGAL
jgi:hypothetical protein